MSERVEALLTSCAETSELIAESQERLADLRLQVDAFRRQCPSRYRPLCDTVDSAGLEVVLRLDAVRSNITTTGLHYLEDTLLPNPLTKDLNPSLVSATLVRMVTPLIHIQKILVSILD